MKIVAWLTSEVDPLTMTMLADSLSDKYFFTVEDDVIVIARKD